MKRSLSIFLFLITMGGFGSVHAQGKISGYMFGDYFYNVARDTAFGNTAGPVGGPKDLQGFQFRRIYVAYADDISEDFTSLFRLEADQVSNTSDGKFGVAVKDAFLKWKNIFPGNDLIFGLSATPAFDISEAAWGYRSLEKTIMDLRGVVGSRDLGVALRGKLDEGGMFNYWLMVANGAGQKPETDKFKRYYLNIQVKPTKNLQFTVYGDYAAAAQKNDPTSTAVPKATVSNSMVTGALFVGYNEPDCFNLGAEGFVQSRAHGQVDPSPSANGALTSLASNGLSLFGSANVRPDLAIVGRFDIYNANTTIKGNVRDYILAGLAYKPNKNVSLIPNVQVETYQTPASGRSIDASVTGRLTFFYVFI